MSREQREATASNNLEFGLTTLFISGGLLGVSAEIMRGFLSPEGRATARIVEGVALVGASLGVVSMGVAMAQRYGFCFWSRPNSDAPAAINEDAALRDGAEDQELARLA